MANAEGFRLVRCPNCLNILPEPHNVTAYKCGGCGTTLRAKICASNGQHVAAKQARQDSDSYSVATAASNGGAPPRNKEQGSESSFDADAPSTEHDSNGAGSGGSGNGDGTLAGQNVVVGHDAENKENHTVEQPTENSETCRVVSGHDDTERRLNASENKTVSSEMSKAAVGVQDPEQKEAGRAAANKKGYLVRVLSRSCDLRSSRDSTDFHSARTSLQSKSFRASEPLQSKIMNTVDELKGDLSELFSNKPADDDGKPKAHQPPRRSKQDGRATRAAAITSSAPLAAYHPAAKHSGYVSRPSKSGQVAVAPRGLPSLRYRRHGVYPFHHSVRTETRPCRHGCCHHSCQPPCYRPCKQEPARPPVMVVKRPPPPPPPPPPPRNHCMPVLRGAPFVICSSCVSLVQLPAEFAVPTRGTRRLQCGSCSGVLSYSYRDPGARKKLQSPFGGDEYSTDEYEQAAGGGHSAAAGFFEQADPVSYSEEYGLSFGISHSTSTEDGQPSLYVSRNSSFNTADDERTGTRDGKLHRLMGYSSASEVLQHSPDLFESFGRRAADAGRTHVDGKGKGVCVAENDAGERDGGAVERSKARSGGWPVHGILKKGIHGLESLKLRS